jgi:two-component sensor histidine kinase
VRGPQLRLNAASAQAIGLALHELTTNAVCPQRRGFGTVVMQETAERSVDGKVDLDYAPSGVTWRLTSRQQTRWSTRELEKAFGRRDEILARTSDC